jgi:hypothetical protein
MIQFFRKFRQKFLIEGSIGNYLKYAIGEILLVVFGILIALQINNWNEEKSERRVEKVYLQNMVEDLKSDLDIYTNYENANDIIYNLIDSLIPNLKSPDRKMKAGKLAFWARMVTVNWKIIHPVKRTYEQMKSSGHLRMVKNRETADSISFYYNSLTEFEGYNEAGMLWANQYIEAIGKVFDTEAMLQTLKERKVIANDPDILLTDDPIIFNQLTNSAQYFYGALKLGEGVSKRKYVNALNLISIIEKNYDLNTKY